MAEPEIALVFSPETWVEQLHRFVTDHGGARVRHVVVDPAVALAEPYRTLVVSWRWPALTRGFVSELHDQGRAVLGVFDREEPVARELLASAGVDAIVESDAPMSEFVARLVALELDDASHAVHARPPAIRGDDRPGRGAHWITVGGPAGAGTTEIAIELARALARRRVVLVDGDEVAPALAIRLALPIEPNLRVALEAVEHGIGQLDDALLTVDDGRFTVLTGLPNVAAWPQLHPPEVLRVVRALGDEHDVVVLDTAAPLDDLPVAPRPRYAVTRALVTECDVLVAVGTATPLGVVRLLAWIADSAVLRPGLATHVVLNRAPRDAHRRMQLEAEVLRSFGADLLVSVPGDRRVEAAAWAGTVVANGPFRRALAPLAHSVTDRVAVPV
jgi:MinD-like ATPase involved in chromosome partitioning or flagellar assembly